MTPGNKTVIIHDLFMKTNPVIYTAVLYVYVFVLIVQLP